MALENSNKKIVKNTLFLSLRMVFVLFITLYTSRVILNVLGVLDYGIYSVIAGFVSMFTFLNSSLSNAIQRFYNFEIGKNGEQGVQKVFNAAVITQIVLALVIALLLETVGLWYLYNKMVLPSHRFEIAFWLFQFSVISTVVFVMQIPYSAAVLAYEKMGYFAFVSIFEAVYKLIFAIIIPFLPVDKLLLYGGFLLSCSILDFVLYWGYCKYHFSAVRICRLTDLESLKGILSFSGWNFFGTFATIAREQGLNMILNLFFGPIVNAARGVAAQVYNAVQGFVNSIGMAVKPQLIQSFAGGDEQRSLRLMYGTSKLSFFILYVMAVPIILEIDYILNLWLGDAVPNYTNFFVSIILVTTFVNNLNANLSNIVHATGKMKTFQLTFFITNLAVLPLSYIAFQLGASPEYGFILYLICTLIMQILCVIVASKVVGFSSFEYFTEVVVPLITFSIAGFLAPFIISQVMTSSFIRFLLILLVSVVMSSFSFYLFGMNKIEKKLCNNIIKSLRRR